MEYKEYKAKDNVIMDKTMDFSVRIVTMFKYLKYEKKEFDMSRQVLRSGTSIGANVHEANEAQTKKDFHAKMCIALKEVSETEYWLILLIKTNFLPIEIGNSILKDCREIKKILTAIVRTTKMKLVVNKGTKINEK